jgi:hypothetical protein
MEEEEMKRKIAQERISWLTPSPTPPGNVHAEQNPTILRMRRLNLPKHTHSSNTAFLSPSPFPCRRW